MRYVEANTKLIADAIDKKGWILRFLRMTQRDMANSVTYVPVSTNSTDEPNVSDFEAC